MIIRPDINVFEIIGLCGSQPKIHLQGNRNLLVEATSLKRSERLMARIAGIKVHCSPHSTFNQCTGFIYDPELLTLDNDEVQSELADQNV